MSKFTQDDLRRAGYVMQPDGSFDRPDRLSVNRGMPNSHDGVIDDMLDGVASVETTTFKRKPKPRMNKVESRWFEELKRRHDDAAHYCKIIPQFRLRISSWDAPVPSHYTSDFAVFVKMAHPDFPVWFCTLWEVKDKRRRGHSDELTRPKLAREHNPFVSSVWCAIWDGTTWDERRLA
jgi:hypothetical protein